MLLKRYKEKFSGNPLGATWGYLRQMARDSLPPNPLVSHDTQPSHLRDPAFLVKTLRYELMTLGHELVTLTLVNPLKLLSTKLSQYIAFLCCAMICWQSFYRAAHSGSKCGVTEAAALGFYKYTSHYKFSFHENLANCSVSLLYQVY